MENAVDTQYTQLNVVGQVNLTGVNLNRTGSFVPSSINSYTIVSNDGTDPIIGAFNGLAEGATVTVNGVAMTITYAGGDGNDVVLLPPASTTATLVGGALTIADTSAAGIANQYTASVVGSDLVISDTSGAVFGTAPAGGTLSSNRQTLDDSFGERDFVDDQRRLTLTMSSTFKDSTARSIFRLMAAAEPTRSTFKTTRDGGEWYGECGFRIHQHQRSIVVEQ